jgi:hypothetical protein
MAGTSSGETTSLPTSRLFRNALSVCYQPAFSSAAILEAVMRNRGTPTVDEQQIQTLLARNDEAVSQLAPTRPVVRDASRIEQFNVTLARAEGLLNSASELGRAWHGVAECARDIAEAIVRLETETRAIEARLAEALMRAQTDAPMIREAFAADQRQIDVIMQKVLAIDLTGASPELMAAWSALLGQANVLSQRSHERMLAYLRR